MNITKALALAAIAAGTALLLKELWNTEQLPEDAPTRRPPLAGRKVTQAVEKTLHKHEGEDSPFVHAFEEALEEKHSAGSSQD